MGKPAATDPAVAGVLKRPFAEQVAFFRGKLGNLIPTEKWSDVWQSGHDRAFMVAGAAKADLLTDLGAAVDRTISEGKSIDAFRKDFDSIVDRHGWNYTGERMWRTRVIYTTNMSTSYAAGRVAQLRVGGFGWWMYKHSDSVLYPRPPHVSWDGLTLAADDPWWQTHFPPNGWGCHCRAIGIDHPDDAVALGGRAPSKAPDDGMDEATGAPAGIDKGWAYMPGDTVSDTVSAMAKKSTQWEYTLAKAYMQGVPAGVRDALALAYRALPSVADDVRRYARRVIEARTGLEIPPYRTMGLLTGADAERVKALAGMDVDSFDYALDPSAVRHVQRGHGNQGAESGRGQVAVTADDYAMLPELLNAPDEISDAGVSRMARRPLVKFTKQIGDRRIVAVFEVRTGRKMLALETMYIFEGKLP